MSGPYDKFWSDPKNWGGGRCGFYFSKDDPRLWVPKRIPALGITINLGHPKGGATLVGIFLAPVAIILGVLIASQIMACG